MLRSLSKATGISYHNEQSNDNLIAPWPLDSTPLQREEKANCPSQGKDRADPVQGDPFLQNTLSFMPGVL